MSAAGNTPGLQPPAEPILILREGPVTVIAIRDSTALLTDTAVEQLARKVGAVIDEAPKSGPEASVMIDFKQLEHVSSALLGALITLNRKAHDRSIAFALARVEPQMLEIFRITKLNRVFTFLGPEDFAQKAPETAKRLDAGSASTPAEA